MVIGETGWTAVDTAGGPNLAFRAHPVNQKMYFDALQAWAAEGRRGNGPQAIFFFQAFDEPWKQGDDGWGLFNTRPPGALHRAGPGHLRRDLGLRGRQLHRRRVP